MSYEINYEDQKFKDVEAAKKSAISESDKLYGEMISSTDKHYEEQIAASKEFEKKQTQLQQEQTDFAIQKVEQQKDQAKKDYTKEQSGAYVDWQKQSNEFGAEAEQRAAQGLENTGFSESSKVAMYTAYQNRVAVARENHSRIVLDFDNQITQARLQNNAALAEIALKAHQERLTLNLQQLQNKNALLLEQASKKTELEQIYHERWQDVLNQFNTENALAEEQRQFDESIAWEKYVYEQAHQSSGGGGGGGGGSRKSSSGSSSTKITKSNTSTATSSKTSSQSAYDQLNAAIAAGASKDKVSNAISLAQRNGTITKSQATELRKTYTPRGVAY